MSTDLKMSTRSAVERYSSALLDLSHSIHAEPELAFEEHRSVEKITSLLAREGFKIDRGVADLDTAFVATFGDGELVLGLCAEYDALPEVGHACGHNVIAAASVGTALALRDVADRLGVTLKVIGTPAEEVGGGKVLMLERGVFDDVSFSMMVHPAPYESCAAKSLAITDLEVHYKGRPSHAAAAPHLGINAADAVTVAQISISLLRQHLEPGQMVTGIVTNGGTVPNVIPARASAMFDVRAENLESLQRLENRIRDCFSAGALATGCTHEVEQVSPIYAELTPDPWLADAYRRAATELGRRPLSPEQEQREKIGSTDMGNVTRVLPAIHPTIAIDCGDAVNHQQEFATACASASADRALLEGALAMAWTTIATATDSQQRARLLARGGAA